MNNDLFTGLMVTGLVVPFIISFTTTYLLASKFYWIWKNWLISLITISFCILITILFTCFLNSNLAVIFSALMWSFFLGINTSLILYKRNVRSTKRNRKQKGV